MSKITDFFGTSPKTVAGTPDAAAEAVAIGEPALDYETIAREAQELNPGEPQALANQLWLDERLYQERSTPRFSKWTRFAYTEFYRRNAESKSVTAFNIRLGRGGGKSTGSQKFAAVEAMLPEERVIPRGERWVFAFVSVPQDAAERIKGLADAIGTFGQSSRLVQSPRAKIETTDMLGNLIQFVALPCNVTGLSGPTLIGWVFDETSKWYDEQRARINHAAEIHVSGISACRGRLVRTMNISSAWGPSGFHHSVIEAGNTRTSHVARIGSDFVAMARDGFLRVAMWEEQQRRDARAAAFLRRLASNTTEDTKSIPTWLGNPGIDAVVTREQVQNIEELKGKSHLAFWLREFGSIPLPENGQQHQNDVLDEYHALAEANRKLQTQETSSLQRFPDLPSWDPRSNSYVGSGGGTFPGGYQGNGSI